MVIQEQPTPSALDYGSITNVEPEVFPIILNSVNAGNELLDWPVLLITIFTIAALAVASIAIKRVLSALLTLRNELTSLRKDVARLQGELFEFVQVGLMIVNSQGKIVDANTQIERLFGWKNDELRGRVVEMLLPKESRYAHYKPRSSFIQANGEGIMAPGRPAGSLRGLHKNNSTFAIEIALKPIEYNDETMTIVEVRDLSESVKRIEQIAQLKVALDATDDSILVYDAKNMCATYANDGAARQLGYNRDEILSMAPTKIKSEKSRNSFPKKLRETINADSKTMHYSDIHITKHGREFPVNLRLHYVNHPNNPYIVSVARDISEQLQVMRSLEANSSQLEQLNQKLELERKNLESGCQTR